MFLDFQPEIALLLPLSPPQSFSLDFHWLSEHYMNYKGNTARNAYNAGKSGLSTVNSALLSGLYAIFAAIAWIRRIIKPLRPCPSFFSRFFDLKSKSANFGLFHCHTRYWKRFLNVFWKLAKEKTEHCSAFKITYIRRQNHLSGRSSQP